MARDIYQEVTDSIVRQIESGLNGKWQCPWRTSRDGVANAVFPVSVSGHTYRGINTLVLLCVAEENGWPNVWGTYKAWKSAGGQIKKGEKGTLVVFWKFTKVEDKETGKEKTIPFARGYTVFNAAQQDGYEIPKPKPINIDQQYQVANAALAQYRVASGVGLEHGGNRAFYSPTHDKITMPHTSQFPKQEGYLAVLAHESAHSTGHESRLDRQFGARFGDNAYAFEELVAEISAAMTCAMLGIDTPKILDDQHAKYVKHWLEVMKGDKRAIFTAASKAQAATDMILAEQEERAIAA